MTLSLTKRATLLTTLALLIAALAPTASALAANDHADPKAQCVGARHARPWDCIEGAPGMAIAPPAQEPNDPGSQPGHVMGAADATGPVIDYVQRGHDLMFNSMKDVHDSLTVMDRVNEVASIIGDLLNEKDPKVVKPDLQPVQDATDFLKNQRDLVLDETKKAESAVSQLNDAASQQGNIATAILQQLSGLLTLIFR